MRNRTKSRECALQMLYQLDIRKASPAEVVDGFWMESDTTQDIRRFAEHLFTGTAKHLSELDALIASHADNWDMKRIRSNQRIEL